MDEYLGGPVAALRRIAFLMERRREETRRVEAFRNAARTVLAEGEEEVAARVAPAMKLISYSMAGSVPPRQVLNQSCPPSVPRRAPWRRRPCPPLLRSSPTGELTYESIFLDSACRVRTCVRCILCMCTTVHD